MEIIFRGLVVLGLVYCVYYVTYRICFKISTMWGILAYLVVCFLGLGILDFLFPDMTEADGNIYKGGFFILSALAFIRAGSIAKRDRDEAFVKNSYTSTGTVVSKEERHANGGAGGSYTATIEYQDNKGGCYRKTFSLIGKEDFDRLSEGQDVEIRIVNDWPLLVRLEEFRNASAV